MQSSTSIDHGGGGRVRDEDAFDVGAVAEICFRYFHGQTRNDAFAEFGDGARYFEGRCLALIDA